MIEFLKEDKHLGGRQRKKLFSLVIETKRLSKVPQREENQEVVAVLDLCASV